MNLDFECPNTIWKIFVKHFPEVSTLMGDHEDPTTIPRRIEDSEFVSAEFEESYKSLELELHEQIATISTYHACKVIDESTYRKHGVRRLRKELMVDWMKDFFHLDAEIDQAVDSLERKFNGSYDERSQNAVFTMCSMSYSEKKLSYKEGCEFIRYTADMLGAEYRQKYVEFGRPCHIEIRTPIDWFERNTDERQFTNLIRSLLSHWLLTKSDEHHYAEDRMNSAVVFQNDIPPEMIYKLHYTN